ncbi:MAG: hypothetical protein ACR2LS_02000 [Thermomicrobiales bacterium]
MANSFDTRSTQSTSGNDPEHHLTALLDRIPGYTGYRDKERRRVADRAIRDDVAAALTAATGRIERVARDLADRRKLREVSAIDSWVQELRHLRDRIQTASYGYTGIFADNGIDARALDQMRLFDEALLAQLQPLEDPIEALEAALVADGDLQNAIDRGLAATRELAARFDTRTQIVQSGAPVAQPNISQLLDSSTESAVPAAWHLDAGDALSIRDDDFLVDARLDVAGPDVFRLFRLGESAAGHWLYVPRDAAERPAFVQLGTEPGSETTEGTPHHAGSALATLVPPQGEARSAIANYDVRSSDEEPDARTITVEWPGDWMVWTGAAISTDEVTIYGSPQQAG